MSATDVRPLRDPRAVLAERLFDTAMERLKRILQKHSWLPS